MRLMGIGIGERIGAFGLRAAALRRLGCGRDGRRAIRRRDVPGDPCRGSIRITESH